MAPLAIRAWRRINEDDCTGWGPHLVVAVVGVAHDGQDVPDGEDDGGQPGSPQPNINLVGEKMVF